MKLSDDIRFFKQAQAPSFQKLEEWAKCAEKMEKALIKIGSTAADPSLHNMPVKVADALTKIEDQARDALSE